ncbi:MAG: glycine--tRNA ligase subunit beta [Pseudomonadota bacterium]
MTDSGALLVEIGMEELPPLSLEPLSIAFCEALTQALVELDFDPNAIERFAAPRRLAVLIGSVATRQPDRRETVKGPPVSVALDEAYKPTTAGEKFAERCGVPFEALGRSSDKKGEYLSLVREVPGQALSEQLQGAVDTALKALPIVRAMRWGDGAYEFVRPVHWVVALLDGTVMPLTVFGQEADRFTHGHRFHTAGPIPIDHAKSYEATLIGDGYVVAAPAARRTEIAERVADALTAAGGNAVMDEALLDEVSALVEWPVAVVGTFPDAYLRLPREVLESTLKKHQRYFPVTASDGRLLAKFVTVSNLDSPEPEKIARGNERVITPRLADAAFFYDADVTTPLAERVAKLDAIVFEKQLGSLGDKTRRLVSLSAALSELLAIDGALAERAATLSRADLVTDMVGEFPDLQGIMGGYYAAAGDEPEAVATAVSEFYRPAFAGDAIPSSSAGQVIAIADRADTLAGVFAAGKRPKGNKDPFGLRRAALGLARIAIEASLSFSLPALLEKAVATQPIGSDDGLATTLYDFIIDRLRAHVVASRQDVSAEVFDAVAANRPDSLVDFMARLDAVVDFAEFDEAESLAAANKRIANLLKKTPIAAGNSANQDLFEADAERALHEADRSAARALEPLLASQEYAEALRQLAGLREPIDRFFDEVMVMANDTSVRDNRLALLAGIRRRFLDIADISVLSRAR